MKNIQWLFGLVLLISMSSCQDEFKTIQQDQLVLPNLPAEVYDYETLNLPSGVTPAQGGFTFTPNGIPIFTGFELKMDNDVATLGRVLFYDKHLSLNNTISCGSCHIQSKAFSDGEQFSKGFEGKITTRNSMAFANPISQRNLFWDSRSFSLVDLSLRPVQNHIEMGMEDLNKLAKKLQTLPYYPALFKAAFGSEKVEPDLISESIAQFVGSITTNKSKFDQRFNGIDQFTALEQLGANIFEGKGKCSQCHGGSTLGAQDGPNDPYGGGSTGGEDLKGTTNIGLDMVITDQGNGNGKFKIPSLRNVALSAPYMHDGRFKTLGDVINHYSNGIQKNPALDRHFLDANNNVIRFNFTEIEKQALIAFLNTLTDDQMTSDPKWSDPFKN